ncbi:MAG: hypothetical protein O2807_07435 [bacterium]|nr:hypothetical protein [bacterium]
MISRSHLIMYVLLAALLAGCTESPIERAVKGKLLPSEANIAVNDYCKSCHVHASLDPKKHVEQVQPKFPKNHELRSATNCLQCHSIRLANIFRKEDRSTTRPHGKVIDLAEVPRPSDQPAPRPKAAAPEAENPKKKNRKWYFFYLF